MLKRKHRIHARIIHSKQPSAALNGDAPAAVTPDSALAQRALTGGISSHREVLIGLADAFCRPHHAAAPVRQR